MKLVTRMDKRVSSRYRSPAMKIREIDPQSEFEIKLVAQRMRQTLVEVLGEEKGGSMYTMDWLVNRVTGHAIARIDHASTFGYFSTVFVQLSSRRSGIATCLMRHVEDWFSKGGIPKIIYNTADNHVALIALFKSEGYEITHAESEMIQLTKVIQRS